MSDQDFLDHAALAAFRRMSEKYDFSSSEDAGRCATQSWQVAQELLKARVILPKQKKMEAANG